MNQNLTLAQNGSVHTDYESVLSSVNWCTPNLMGFSLCVNASASGGIVILQLNLQSPFGSYSKTFNINSNACFNWNLPIKLGPSIEICVSNLTTGPRVSFSLRVGLCLTLPLIGKKCATWSHDFVLPFMNESMLRSEHVSSEDLAALYVLLAHNAAADTPVCNCH
ncbi:hypothetical protein [Taibaiella koreensis]|uniref:hypothetical protein n=1 Tax=Taibaiella koreensis TaxID=1268548 RepID=UPI000E59F762|nr:hypothetical protein [Taibaiella koreensis]